MAYSKTQVGSFVAAGGLRDAPWDPADLGLLLCCPVMRPGMHGGADNTKVGRPRPPYQRPQELRGLAIGAEYVSLWRQ